MALHQRISYTGPHCSLLNGIYRSDDRSKSVVEICNKLEPLPFSIFFSFGLQSELVMIMSFYSDKLGLFRCLKTEQVLNIVFKVRSSAI